MKYLLIFFLLVEEAFGQQIPKPSIDLNTLGKWPTLGSEAVISGNGKYVGYIIDWWMIGQKKVVIQSTVNSWKREFNGIKFDFSGRLHICANDSIIFFKGGDSLYLVYPGGDSIRYIPNLVSYTYPENNEGDWVACKLNNGSKDLMLKNLSSGKERRFEAVTDYRFDNAGKELVFQTISILNRDTVLSLNWFDCATEMVKTIWKSSQPYFNSERINNYHFDKQGEQLIFMVTSKRDRSPVTSIWRYKRGQEEAEKKIDSHSKEIDPGFDIAGIPLFSNNGMWVFFDVKRRPDTARSVPNAVKVDVWGYKDLILLPDQPNQDSKRKRTFAFSSTGHTVTEVAGDDEDMVGSPYQISGNYAVIKDHVSASLEYWWVHSPQPSFWLVSLQEGTRKLLKQGKNSLSGFSFSPGGKWLAYWDSDKTAYFTCNIQTGAIVGVSNALPQRGAIDYLDAVYFEAADEVAGWYEGDSALIVYDNYDIWKIDPSGKKAPINLTASYGFKKQIRLRIVTDKDRTDNLIFSSKDTVLITGFNDRTKYNGFFQTTLDRPGKPTLLTMGPYTYYCKYSQFGGVFSAFSLGRQPEKAKNAAKWLVTRQSAREAPNFFVTEDFKTFRPLSTQAPQEKYNWISTELHTWRMLDGKLTQGVLYKPENFDPKKKYPVIVHYYEKLSHNLYQFPYPYVTYNEINIPWFVSNGYLVFIADIYYSVANRSNITVGQHAYNSIVSAARYLAKFPFVDAKKMGIQGHSFGGLETSYLVTHTNAFAAACEMSGSTDPISAYLTLVPNSGNVENLTKQSTRELEHELYGTHPWARPDLYQQNSAVLNVDKVTTPLLIMHNISDRVVQWRQGVELYMAMRRLGKKCWMLQYDESGHSLNEKDAKDFTVRLTEFFDYYLKGAPPPVWMTKGIPARLKGLEDGLRLDTSETKP